MIIKHKTRIVLLIAAFSLAIYIGSCTERTFEEDTLPMQDEKIVQDEKNVGEAKEFKEIFTQDKNSRLYRVPGYRWPKISALGTVSAVIFFVALTIGIVSYFIGHNAGGRENKGQIFFAIGIATTVGLLGRSITLFLQIHLYQALSITMSPFMASTIVEVIFFTIWTLFVKR